MVVSRNIWRGDSRDKIRGLMEVVVKVVSGKVYWQNLLEISQNCMAVLGYLYYRTLATFIQSYAL